MKSLLLTSLLLIKSINAFCQFDGRVDEAAVIKNHFEKLALDSGSSQLYNGYEYRDYPTSYFKEGHQFLGNSEWNTGTLTYESKKFNNIPIRYDIVNDVIIIRSFDRVSSVTLLKSKVQRFSFSGRSFIKIPSIEKDNPSNHKFYEELYHQKSILLAKRNKKVVESVSAIGVEKSIEVSNRYYVLLGNEYRQFKKPESLLKILSHKKQEIRVHLIKNQIELKKDPERAMVAIMSYYDQINN
jgi:hypothetical protein